MKNTTTKQIIKLGQSFEDKLFNKIVYYGLFLDDSTKKILLQWWKETVGKNFLNTIHADHMTVKFRPTSEDIKKYSQLVGQSFDLRVTGYAEDNNCQTVSVLPIGIYSANNIPHITISCADGISPVYSNKLLEKSLIKVIGPTISAIFDSFPRLI